MTVIACLVRIELNYVNCIFPSSETTPVAILQFTDNSNPSPVRLLRATNRGAHDNIPLNIEVGDLL